MRKRIPITVVEKAESTATTAPKRPSKVRPSKMGKWRAGVLIGVHVLVGLHIAHWLTTGSSMTPVEPSEAMAYSRSSIVNAGLIFFAVTILLTAVFGRFFCGWGCHLVALQDFCRYLMMKIGITPRPLNSKALAIVPALAFIYMFILPALFRVWGGDSLGMRGAELTTEHFWATFPGWIVGALTFLVCGFACVYFLGAKGFCTYACPYGAIFAAADRIAPMRIRVTDACNQCGHCTSVCSSNILVHQEVRDWGMVTSPGCMKCMDCVSVCPTDALYYGSGPIPLLAKPRVEPSQRARRPLQWRDEVILSAAFVVGFLIVNKLYGVVPFLMALGVAGVMAFLTLTSLRLLREATVERSGLRLKRDGKLLPQGWVFVAVTAALFLFFAHSAVLQQQAWTGNAAYLRAQPGRMAILAEPGVRPLLSAQQRAQLGQGIAPLVRVERWGLWPTLGNDARLAWLYAISGDEASSERHALVSIERDELPSEMHLLLAHADLLRGDAAAATVEWHRSIDTRPDLPEGYLALGTYLARSGDLVAAQSVFDRGLSETTDSPQLFYNAALARAVSGQVDAAVPLFESALKLDPRYLEARENLAGLMASLGRFEESVQHYRLAVEQSPNDAETRVLYARALLGTDDRKAAIAQLQRALEIDPQSVQARTLMTDVSGGAIP